MNDPYVQLGLPPSADETEIRQRYLELVRQFPPDRGLSGSRRSALLTTRCAIR